MGGGRKGSGQGRQSGYAINPFNRIANMPLLAPAIVQICVLLAKLQRHLGP